MSQINHSVLAIGARFSLKNTAHEVTFISASTVRYSSIDGGRPKAMPVNRFWELVDQNVIGFLAVSSDSFSADPSLLRLSRLTSNERTEMNRRVVYVRAVLRCEKKRLSKTNLSRTINQVALQVNDDTPPSRATLARWVKRYIESNADLMCLVPRHHHKGNRYKRIGSHIEAVITSSIYEHYLKDDRLSVQQIYCNVKGQISSDDAQEATGKIVSESTIYRRVRELDPYLVARTRYGQRYADNEFRAAGASLKANRLMELVMIDGHKMDVIVVDPETGEILGRPYLVCLFDVCTRVVVGWHISLMPFCSTTALAAIKDIRMVEFGYSRGCVFWF